MTQLLIFFFIVLNFMTKNQYMKHNNHQHGHRSGLVAFAVAKPGGWTHFHSSLHGRRRPHQSLVLSLSQPSVVLTHCNFHRRFLGGLTPRSLCARLSPLPLVLGSTYQSPKVMVDSCSTISFILKVERSGKNAVTFAEWPHEEFPNFAAGLAYFLTRCVCITRFSHL